MNKNLKNFMLGLSFVPTTIVGLANNYGLCYGAACSEYRNQTKYSTQSNFLLSINEDISYSETIIVGTANASLPNYQEVVEGTIINL